MPIEQLMVLGLIISAFAIFIIVLAGVSLCASVGKQEAAPATTTVTPARRPGEARLRLSE